MRISESVVLFSCSEQSFYRFLAFNVDILTSECVADVLALINIVLPDMTRNNFNMVFAVCALFKVLAVHAIGSTTLVFPITISIRR